MISKRQAGMGIIIWLIVFGALVVVVAGFGEFVDTLGSITAQELAIILVAVAVGVVAMGASLFVITRSLGLGVSFVEAIFLNTSVSLAHNLTPFGQAGGAPVGAVVLADRSGSPYEECLAAISMKDMISFVPTLVIFSVGGPYLLFFGEALPLNIRLLFAVFTVLVVVAVAAVLAVRRYPDRVRALLHRLVGLGNRTVARLPLVPHLDEATVEERVDNFSDSIGTVATDRKTVLQASTLATTSFVAQGTLLWLALAAVGVDVQWMLAVFIVPVSLFAAGLPLPGGSGGVEAVQIVTLLAVTTAVRPEIATAVLLSRGLVYWTPIFLGSVTLITFQLQDIAEPE